MAKVGLFIPCYVDQFYPQVGMATLKVLQQLGLEVEYPEAQLCCGQLTTNAGSTPEAARLARHFLDVFGGYEHVVAPSASCVTMVRHHYDGFLGDQPRFEQLRRKTYELCEFLVDVVKVAQVEGEFPYKVGLHQGCHGLRELRMGRSSERMVPAFDKVRSLLERLRGITLVGLARPDECCGFGGTFAVSEAAVSCRMGQDRLTDHQQAGAEVLTSVDMSCLMHLEGLVRRERRPLKILHVAEILSQARLA